MLNEDYKDILKALVAEKVKFLIPSVADLIRNKRASGRTKDMADAEALEDLEISEPGVPGDA